MEPVAEAELAVLAVTALKLSEVMVVTDYHSRYLGPLFIMVVAVVEACTQILQVELAVLVAVVPELTAQVVAMAWQIVVAAVAVEILAVLRIKVRA
jgi:hypothetical protein